MRTPNGQRRRIGAGALAALWLTALLAASPLGADTKAERAEARLESVQTHIRALRARLSSSRSKAQRLQARLAKTELAASRVAKRLRQTRHQQRAQQARLRSVRADRRARRAQLARQRAALAADLRTAYMSGGHEELRLLLNQEDPAQLARMLVYYDYVNRARTRRIAQVKDTLAALSKLEDTAARRRRALARVSERLRQKQAAFERARSERAEVLAALRQELTAGDRSLKALRSQRGELKELLASLRTALADIPETARAHAPFAARKGELPWPVSGRVEARSDGAAARPGVTIAAPAGTPVRAVAGGRVVFAEWMRGFGLLTIVDHGDDFLTLYGRNQALYKTVGEWVRAGELIARVGDSGGGSTSGLYFEIRHAGEPLDASAWWASPQPVASGGSG